MSNSFAATFSLDPSKFPYSKQCITRKREARAKLQNQLLFDLVLSEVAQVPNSTKLYPPRSINDLRSLHEAIEKCPVDLLKKQCCIYYILRDWSTHVEYSQDQMIPQNYCSLMDSYWYLDNLEYENALNSLTTPGLTPNFATKIMSTFQGAGEHDMLVTYVHTIQSPLDTEEKTTIYVDALLRINLPRAIFYTRTLEAGLREKLLTSVLDFACTTAEGATTLSNFPFDEFEEGLVVGRLSRHPGLGLEALVLRLTMLGRYAEVLRLRERHGGGRPEIENAIRQNMSPVDLKMSSSIV